ncbi:importin alpha, partial [Reticulomyxa filosa]
MFGDNDRYHREFQRGLDTEYCRQKRHDDRFGNDTNKQQMYEKQREGELMKRRRAMWNHDKSNEMTIDKENKEGNENTESKSKQKGKDTEIDGNEEKMNKEISWDCLSELTEDVTSMYALRCLLSNESSTRIEDIIHQGLIPVFLEHAQDKKFPSKQFDAVWFVYFLYKFGFRIVFKCLTNIAAGTSYETGQVIKNGVLDVLMTLLAHNPKDTPNNDLIEQIFWCFGNISGDCFYYTYLLLVQKKLLKFVFGKMLANNNHHFNISVLLQWCWVINNMFRKSSSSEGIGWEQSSSNTNADRDSNSNDIIEIDYYVPDEEEENFCEDVLQRQLRQCRTTIVSFLPNVLQLFQYLYHAFNNINDTSF